LSDQIISTETEKERDFKRLENVLRVLWEKVRLVSDALIKLREENRELKESISSLKLKEQEWLERIQQKEKEIEELRSKLEEMQSDGRTLLSKEEVEHLKLRLRDLIAKINSRL